MSGKSIDLPTIKTLMINFEDARGALNKQSTPIACVYCRYGATSVLSIFLPKIVIDAQAIALSLLKIP